MLRASGYNLLQKEFQNYTIKDPGIQLPGLQLPPLQTTLQTIYSDQLEASLSQKLSSPISIPEETSNSEVSIKSCETVFLYNVPTFLRKAEIQSIFSNYGKIVNVKEE